MLINVTMRECRTNGQAWTSNHRADDENDAIDRAVKKNFGKAAFFQREYGLSGNKHPSEGRIYGQVFRSLKGETAASSVTGRISIDTSRAGKG